MTSKKISQFNVSASLNHSDLFTFVVNGTNKNISYSSFKSDLGVTGTLSQVGDPAGAPVLDNNGTDYFIRNLESAKGIIAELSPENGVSLSCNFSQQTTGENIIKNLSDDIYSFKSLTAGANIALSSDDENIEISFIGDAASSKTVPVSSMDDFPSPVDGVITLEDGTDYLVLADLETTNRFYTTGSTTIRAASSQIVRLRYTGVDAMITGVSHNTLIRGITLSAPNGSLFDFSNASPTGIFQFIESNVEECDSIGTFNNLFILRFDAIGWEDIKTEGMLFTGVMFNVDLDRGIVFINGGTFIDLGTSILNELSISKQVLQLTSDPSAVFLSGLTGSNNILAGGEGACTDNRVSVLTSPLSGITANDVRYEFFFNTGIQDSMSDALISVQGSSTETVISGTGVKTKVNNIWTEQDASRFTFDSNGRLTYAGEKKSRLPIDVTATILGASGGDKQTEMCIGINGTPLPETCKQTTTNSSKAASVSTFWQHEFEAGDYVEVFVSNESDTTNIIVQQSVVRIN